MAGGLAGAKLGAMAMGAAGAALGSFAPVIGNAIGGAVGVGVGALGGGIIGSLLGEDVVEAFFEPGPADKADAAAQARTKRQEANKAMDEALRRNRQAKDGAVGDQASLTGARNLNVYIDGTKVHEEDITNVFTPMGTRRIPVDRPPQVSTGTGTA